MNADAGIGEDCLRSFAVIFGCNSVGGKSNRGTDDLRLLESDP